MNQDLISIAKKAVEEWHGTDEYHQASEIISMLIDELEDKENQAYWAEYTGEDRGFHYCSNCKKQAFNFEDGSEVFETLTEFCPYCGRHMKNAEI